MSEDTETTGFALFLEASMLIAGAKERVAFSNQRAESRQAVTREKDVVTTNQGTDSESDVAQGVTRTRTRTPLVQRRVTSTPTPTPLLIPTPPHPPAAVDPKTDLNLTAPQYAIAIHTPKNGHARSRKKN